MHISAVYGLEINNMIAINRVDGGVSILTMTDEATSLDGEIEKWKTTYPNQYVSHRDLQPEDLPESREFRNAWADLSPTPELNIDLVKARDLALVELRSERDKALQQTDTNYLIALSKGEGVSTLLAEKERLRNITEPLKALEIEEGMYDDEATLNQIRQLRNLER